MKLHRTHFEVSRQINANVGYDMLAHFAEFQAFVGHIRSDTRYKKRFLGYDLASPLASASEALGFLERGPTNVFSALYRRVFKTDQSQAMATFREWLATYNFWAAGSRVFQVTSDLARMLAETELRVERRFLRLPFPCVFLSWEGLDLTITCSTDQSQWPLAGAYVYEINERDYDDKIRRLWRFFFVTSEDRQNGTGNVLFTTVSLDGEPNDIIDEEATTAAINRPNIAARFVETNIRQEEMGRFLREMPPLARLAINSLLYISAPGADLRDCTPDNRDIDSELARTSKPKRRRKLEDERSSRSALSWVRVGSRVKAPTDRAAAQTSDGGIRRLTYRFQVRGHWRTYWKLDESLTPEEKLKAGHTRESATGKTLFGMLKWIEPHDRGPDVVAAVSKRYAVE